jgi:heme/copper-type cytochrome/quinol oxidase subunit 1
MAVYPHDPQWKFLNDLSTLGAVIIGLSTVLFVVNVVVSWKKYPAGDNPWDAHTLEWFTTSPPPHHNFYRLPQIRSERPTWDHNHPDYRALHHGVHEGVHEHAQSSEETPV